MSEELTPLQRAQATMRARREAGETIVRLNPIEKARAKPTSLRFAVNAKCWDCQCGDADPNPRERIRSCPVTKCPLHPVRPYQRGDAEDETP